MKKSLLVMAVAGMLFTSCEKNDEEGKSNEELIVGEWEMEYSHRIKFLNNVKAFEEMDSTSTTLTFTSSTFLIAEGPDTIDFGTYTLVNNSLTAKGDDTLTFNIQKLTEAQLNLFSKDEYNMGSDVIRDEMRLYFTR